MRKNFEDDATGRTSYTVDFKFFFFSRVCFKLAMGSFPLPIDQASPALAVLSGTRCVAPECIISSMRQRVATQATSAHHK
jgi:hypothetical protein